MGRLPLKTGAASKGSYTNASRLMNLTEPPRGKAP